MDKNLLVRFCRYKINESEIDLVLKINFMLILLFIAILAASSMAIVRFYQGAMTQVLFDASIAVIAFVLIIWLCRKKKALFIVARIILSLAFLGLIVGHFFAPPAASTLLGIVVTSASIYLFFSIREFTLWLLFFSFLFFFGELFLVKKTHILTLETVVALMMVLLIIVIIRISDKAKELHKENQIKVAEDNRNALLSKMIGSIAHEWRQPLGTVTAITTKVMLKNQMGTLDSKMLEADMHKIEEIAQQLSGIINQFHHIFSTDIFQEKFHIVPFLEEIVQKQSENPEKNNIIFENELPVDTKVQYSKSELSMVILAVVANAFDHSLDKDDLITVKLFSRDSNICIAIENRGEPIDSDKVAMIFDPYYSTKPENQGVGLGLYIAKTLVQKNGGSMQVQNSSNGVIVNICMKKE